MKLATAAATLLLALAPLAHAGEATPMAADPVIEARLVVISEELRCLVCQNESLAASRAELANDLREEVRKLISQGKTDAEIKEYLVARYGDFVLLRPPFNAQTLLLWGAPFLILLAGVAFVWRRGRQRMGEEPAAPAPLTDEERSRIDRLMRDEQG